MIKLQEWLHIYAFKIISKEYLRITHLNLLFYLHSLMFIIAFLEFRESREY